MMKHVVLAVILTSALPVTGCSQLLGPSCGEYSGASVAQQQQMSLDWLVFVGEVQAGTSVAEVSGQVGWAQQELMSACSSSGTYVRLHMFRPESLPLRSGG